jgi:predicted permease
MPLLVKGRSFLRNLFLSRRVEVDLNQEVHSHLEMLIEENICAGMPPHEAQRAARIELGGIEQVKEQVREERIGNWLHFVISDCRYGARQLRKNPGFTAVAVLSLALCIGANLTIFAVIDSILLRPLPFPEPGRLVTMFNSYPKARVQRMESSLTNYYERRGDILAFSSLSLFGFGDAIIGEPGSTERAEVVRISPEFFATLGVGPTIGRVFKEEETTSQADGVAIITDAYWRERFNADPSVLGRTLRVDGSPRTIIGVLPPSFRFLSSRARLYFPLSSNAEQRGPDRRHWGSGADLIARLKPGATLADAQAQIDSQNAALEMEVPQAQRFDPGFRTTVLPLHADLIASVRSTLLLLQAGVLFLLLIGALNLLNLLVIRGSVRAREFAIRNALGARRSHVVAQVMTETLMLTLAGALSGLLVGAGGIRFLITLGADKLPLGAQIAFDGRLAVVALLGAVVIGMLIASPIVWLSLRGHASNGLQSETHGTTANRAAQGLRHGFVVAQIALAFVLLAGAGLLGLSLKQVMAVSPGFRSDHILTCQLTLPFQNYHDVPALLSFSERLLEAAHRPPGVSAVGVTNNIPLSGNRDKLAIAVKGYLPRPGESLHAHYVYGVTGDYFAAMGISLRNGRFLEAADSRRREKVCVVDEDLARHYWPEGGAIGQHLFLGAALQDDAEAFAVVGVVVPVKQADLAENQAQGAVYVPYGYRVSGNIYLVARTPQSPVLFAATLRNVIRGVDPEIPVNDLRPMDVLIKDSLGVRRSSALLAGIFAGVALLLTAVGTYGVLAYAVSQRRREIGLRMALGALPRQVFVQFLRLGAKLFLAGMTFGALGAWATGRAMQSLLFSVSPLPFGVMAAAATLMISVVLLATLLPARRATRIDPMVALRYE